MEKMSVSVEIDLKDLVDKVREWVIDGFSLSLRERSEILIILEYLLGKEEEGKEKSPNDFCYVEEGCDTCVYAGLSNQTEPCKSCVAKLSNYSKTLPMSKNSYGEKLCPTCCHYGQGYKGCLSCSKHGYNEYEKDKLENPEQNCELCNSCYKTFDKDWNNCLECAANNYCYYESGEEDDV